MDWEGESFLDSSEIYDPARDEWTLGPKLPRGLGIVCQKNTLQKIFKRNRAFLF